MRQEFVGTPAETDSIVESGRQVDKNGTGVGVVVVYAAPAGTMTDALYQGLLSDSMVGLTDTKTTTISGVAVSTGLDSGMGYAFLRAGDRFVVVGAIDTTVAGAVTEALITAGIR